MHFCSDEMFQLVQAWQAGLAMYLQFIKLYFTRETT